MKPAHSGPQERSALGGHHFYQSPQCKFERVIAFDEQVASWTRLDPNSHSGLVQPPWSVSLWWASSLTAQLSVASAVHEQHAGPSAVDT